MVFEVLQDLTCLTEDMYDTRDIYGVVGLFQTLHTWLELFVICMIFKVVEIPTGWND